ncbi:MAG: hypothetical protein KBE27_04295 [Syntrophorhabdaceae bacterium]|nr:hypothetical protein [Syntrophorhabdaceae bacterium]
MDEISLPLRYLLVSFIIFFLMLFVSDISFSQDNLNLTGIIRSVDSVSGIVRIEVINERCRGLWNFKFPDYAKDDLDNSMVGRRVQFTIDSPVCDPKRLHSIVLER